MHNEKSKPTSAFHKHVLLNPVIYSVLLLLLLLLTYLKIFLFVYYSDLFVKILNCCNARINIITVF